jgi:copper chaperone
MERLSLTIAGMSCGHCVRGVERALGRLPGVQVEQVGIGSAVIACDTAAVTPDHIRSAIADEGYEVRRMESAT